MRKFLIPLLLASVAASPAFAAPRDRNNDDDTKTERHQSREDRQQSREDRQQVREDRQQVREDRQQVQVERAPVVQSERNVVRRDAEDVRAARIQALESNRISREERVQVRDDRVQARQDQRAARQAERRASRVPVVSNTPRPGTQPPPPTEVRHSPAVHWNTDWRHNSRYNWYNWRHRHRSLFTLGAYYDPFGWGYQPYSIGWRMWPNYYRSSYWLNDPWQYRLPYSPPGTRWIRYYDDAILVDMWSGQVVDVIYDFFW